MTLATLRTDTRTRMGIPTTDALYPDATLTNLINAALHQFETEADWPWLEASETIACVNGTQSYPAAAASLRTISVLDTTTGVLLRELTLEELSFWGTPAGAPRGFARSGSALLLVPVPTSTNSLTHRYVRSETDLSADSDDPLVPTSYEPAIVEYAAYLAFRRAGNAPEAGAALAGYEGWVEQAKRRADRWAATDGGGERPKG